MIEQSIAEAYEAGKKFRDLVRQGMSHGDLVAYHRRRPDGRTREGKAWIQGARGDRMKIVRPPRYEKAEA